MNGTGPLASFPAGHPPAFAGQGGGHWRCRSLAADDLPWLATLYASTREEELRALGWPAEVLAPFLAQQFSAQHQHYLAQYPQACYLAIEVDGRAVGRLYLDESGDEHRVVDISLLPAWRGQGIGAALLRQVQAAAAALGHAVALNVLTGNTGAQRLYARLGFVAAAQAPGDALYLPMRWHAHDPVSGVS